MKMNYSAFELFSPVLIILTVVSVVVLGSLGYRAIHKSDDSVNANPEPGDRVKSLEKRVAQLEDRNKRLAEVVLSYHKIDSMLGDVVLNYIRVDLPISIAVYSEILPESEVNSLRETLEGIEKIVKVKSSVDEAFGSLSDSLRDELGIERDMVLNEK